MSVASTLAAGTIKQLNRWKCFNGAVYKYIHLSTSTKTEMKFTVFMPAAASTSNKVPVLYWLSGLTCTEDNFIHKAGAMRAASHHGVALICPDTSPRGVKIEGDSDHWDFGVGAGFYVDAIRAPWSSHYRMYSYVTQELPSLVQQHLPVTEKRSVFGHSMGGHGALICFLKNPGFYQSVSAFAPICNPSQTGWGIKAFSGYLGEEKKDLWKSYDATELVSTYSGPSTTILIDQGNVDEWLEKKELEPQRFITAAQGNSKVTVDYRERDGYDHSYFYIQTFIDEHIEYHAKALKGTGAKL